MNSDELRIRIDMCRFCIKVLTEDCKDDPRQPDALAHYNKQLEELMAKQNKPSFDSMIPKPPDIVVHLQPARIFGTVPK